MGKKPTKVFLDDVYVIACPKSELEFDETKKATKGRDIKRAQLKVDVYSWIYSRRLKIMNSILKRK